MILKCIIFDFFNVLYPYSREAEETVSALKMKGYKIGGISSLSPAFFEEVAKHYKIDYAMSCAKLGLSKENQETYKRFLSDYNLSADECLIIDDDQVRLAAAKQTGIKTVWLKLFAEQQIETTDFEVKNFKTIIDIADRPACLAKASHLAKRRRGGLSLHYTLIV